MERKSGVLMHISTLFGDYSIGSFGRNAKYFIDFLKSSGFTYWQTLPFCMVDECNSPYKSYSSFAINPYFIDLEELYEKGLITEAELSNARGENEYSCEYERLALERIPLLFKASKRCENKKEIKKYIESNPYILNACEFLALKDENDGKAWNEWTKKEPDPDRLFMWEFIQYEGNRQWGEVKKYANENGIKIIGDLPIYVSHDSSDVWASRELFLLDEEGLPKKVAGVPPDYFCPDGQLWGNPIYNWDKMRDDGFLWWRERMGYMLKLFDGIRIDHFRGFSDFWSVDYGEETAKNGRWEAGPGKEFIDAIKEVSKDRLIIAEDLGDVSGEVYKLVEYSKFPGMRVLQFGFLSEEDNMHRPHNYPENSVAYTGTHDNNTLLGYVWECSESQRKNLLEYVGYTNENWDLCYDNIIRTMFSSHSGLLILPIQDLLGYGGDTRLNTPGRAEGNWAFRITKAQLDSIDKNKYKKLNTLYGR